MKKYLLIIGLLLTACIPQEQPVVVQEPLNVKMECLEWAKDETFLICPVGAVGNCYSYDIECFQVNDFTITNGGACAVSSNREGICGSFTVQNCSNFNEHCLEWSDPIFE